MSEMLEKLDIDCYKYHYSFYGKDTISASWELYQILLERVPYMISMISADLSQLIWEDPDKLPQKQERKIPRPDRGPTIGVIDNLFDEEVYFSEWVENTDFLDEYESVGGRDVPRDHGTEVTSIIVDGPGLNPWLDDGCGRFKVRHFGVCVDRISVPRLVNKIRKIVNDNPDIHVWNLSLGTEDEISKDFISYDGSVLDELQATKNLTTALTSHLNFGVVITLREINGENRLQDFITACMLRGWIVNEIKIENRLRLYQKSQEELSFDDTDKVRH